MCRKSLFKCVHTSLLQHNCMCRTRTRTEQKQNAHCRTKIAERTYIYRTPFSPLYSLEKMFSNFPIFEGLFLFSLRKFILSSFEEICSLQFWGNISSPVLRKFILSSFVEIYPACSSSGTNSLRPASISASWAWWGWLGWWSSSSWSWSRWSWCIFAKCIFPKSLHSISDKHLKCFFCCEKLRNGVLKKGKQEKCSSL